MCFGSKCLTFFFSWEMILRVQNVIWIFGWVACLIAFMSVFFSSLKNCFEQSQQLLDTSRPIYWAFWASFLDSCYRNFDLIRFLRINLDSFSIASRSIEEVYVCSIDSRSMEVTLLWTPLDSSIYHILILDTSRYLIIHRAAYVSIYRVSTISISFLPDLSRQNLSPHLPKLISLSL